MSNISVFRKGTTTNKLTIAKDRIELKLRDDVNAEGEVWLLAFAMKVVERAIADIGLEATLRGRFRRHHEKDCISIDLSTGGYRHHVRSYHSESMEIPIPPKML